MKKQKGITLIALVITIIVLLILAGVALATLTGQGSIVENANKTVEKYNEQAGEEQNLLGAIEDKMAEYGLMQPLTGTAEVDENGLATKRTLIKPDTNSELQIVIPVGFAPVILEGSNSTTSLPGESGKVKNIMPAEEWKNITEEQINKGIVIVDHAITYDNGQTTGTVPDFNEYVWVTIIGSGSNIFAREPWTTPYGYDSSGSWGSGGRTHLLAEISTANYWWEDKTTIEYTNMLTSVSRSKGFYISRYEASKDSTATIAQSKRGQAPWTNVTATTAITASANNNQTVHTHLMYGIEWDSTLNWLISSGTKTLTEIQNDSRNWGNYKNSTEDAAKEPYEQNTKQNTGASEYWKANNIYDLAGNVEEWTQEKYSTKRSMVTRGGVCSHNGYFPAANRDDGGVGNVAILRIPFQFLLVALCTNGDVLKRQHWKHNRL